MSNQQTNPPKVFISYSHDSDEHKDQVLELSDRLRDEGIDCIIDQYEEFSPDEGWPRWTEKQIREADFVLMVCTETFCRRLMGEETPGKGRGARWEGNTIYQLLYNAGTLNNKFIPVLLENGKPEHIPTPLQGTKYYSLSIEYEQLYRKLTNQPSTPKNELGRPRVLPPRQRRHNFPTPETEEEQQNTAPDTVTEQGPRPEFFAYDDAWVGREPIVSQLQEKIANNCRILILVGITGIGKTALGERLVEELEEWLEGNWNSFSRENFDDEVQSADFGSAAARWLEKWGEVVTPDDRKDTQRLLYRLVRYMQENRRLVLIDSLEKILEGDEEQGWSNFQDEWWVKFFKSFLAADSCQSSIIITSQDLPQQIEAEGTRYQPLWYCQPVTGLEEAERIKLFEKTGLEINADNSQLTRIGAAYEGHPLALRVIAGEILNHPFNGNVAAYWYKHGNEIEEVEKAIEEAQTKGITASADDQWKLDRYTRNLRTHVRSRLQVTFDRLQKEVKSAYLLLCEGSVYRCAVPEDFWLSHLEDWDYNKEERLIALGTLRERYLVEESLEKEQYQLRQHNLIRSLSLERLKQLDNEDE